VKTGKKLGLFGGVFLVAVILSVALPVTAADPAVTEGPPLTYARTKCGVTVLDGKIYVIGGKGDDNNPTPPIEVFDPATNQWQVLGPKSWPQNSGYSGHQFAVGGKLYSFGGKSVDGKSRNKKGYVFDPTTESWQELPGEASMGHYDGQGAVVGTKIYLFGGEDDALTNEAFDYAKAVDIYDTATGEWSVGAPQPNPRQDAYAVPFGNKIYIVAGQGGNKDDATTDTMEVYDIETDTWQTGFTIPYPWEVPRAVVVNDKVYILTGKGEGSMFIIEFDPRAMTFKEMSATLKTPRYEGAVVALGNKIYCITGKSLEGDLLTSMEIYDPTKDTYYQ